MMRFELTFSPNNQVITAKVVSIITKRAIGIVVLQSNWGISLLRPRLEPYRVCKVAL